MDITALVIAVAALCLGGLIGWLGYGLGMELQAVARHSPESARLPTLRIGGAQLTKGETSGPNKDSKLTPRIQQTAAALWLIYCGLNALCALAYWLGGMNWFDAITHAFATIATCSTTGATRSPSVSRETTAPR